MPLTQHNSGVVICRCVICLLRVCICCTILVWESLCMYVHCPVLVQQHCLYCTVCMCSSHGKMLTYLFFTTLSLKAESQILLALAPQATHCCHLPGVVGERPQVLNCQGLSLLSHSLTVCLSPLPLFTCYAVRLSCVPGLVSQHHHVVSQYAIPTEYRRWTPLQGD